MKDPLNCVCMCDCECVYVHPQALGLCVSCGQPLKAVMLEGWKLHHDPNVSLGRCTRVSSQWYIVCVQGMERVWRRLRGMSSGVCGRPPAGKCWMR